MRYSNGIEPKLGDRVQLSNGEHATIIADIIGNSFESELIRKSSSDCLAGYMVRTDGGALVSFEEASTHDFDLAHP
jgi:hypothetical protein